MKARPLILCFALAAVALCPMVAVTQDLPDLTVGGLGSPEQYEPTFLMGPTGVKAWTYLEDISREQSSTSKSRQILVRAVESGSPADGWLQPDDVILGVSGNGSNPAEFSKDALVEMDNAFESAWKRDPALLKLIRWRAGQVTTVTIALRPLSEVGRPTLTTGHFLNPNDYKYRFVLGPTGIEGYADFEDGQGGSTENSREIFVRRADAGSPADGIVQIFDVIIGASGDGSEPVNFSRDCRRELADAINDAEARDPAHLKLLRWRDNEVTTVTLTLETMGAYSSTAPYDCPKSENILEKALDYTFHNQDKGKFSANILSFLAANDPSDPNNEARLEKARQWAYDLIPSEQAMYEWNSSDIHSHGSGPWAAGHDLISLAEFYLLTGDDTLLPAIYAHVSLISSGLNAVGAAGHGFAGVSLDGGEKRILSGGYGALNSAGMPCVLALVLAKHCGIDHPWLDDALARSNGFFGSFAGRGAIPYGIGHAVSDHHDSNGKSGLAALIFSLQDGYDFQGDFFSKMAASAASYRDRGHTGPYFHQLWTPLGAAVAGEEAAALYFKQARWQIDLSRRWDGGFTLSAIDNWGWAVNKGTPTTWTGLYHNTPAILTYALPLRNLYITGRMHQPEQAISDEELDSIALASNYDASSRTTDQLFDDLVIWSLKVRDVAGHELARRIEGDSSILPRMIAMTRDQDIERVIGGCIALRALQYIIKQGPEVPEALLPLLTHPEGRVQQIAVSALKSLSDQRTDPHINEILAAFLSTARPFDPLDPDDPAQLVNREFGEFFFKKRWSVRNMDKELMYDAMRAIKDSRVGPNMNLLEFPFIFLSEDEFLEVADVYVDSLFTRPIIENQQANSYKHEAIKVLERFGIAEGVPLARILLTTMVGVGKSDEMMIHTLGKLENYAGSVNTVTPDPEAVELAEFLVERDTKTEEALAFLSAVANDTNPAQLMVLKNISSVTADEPVLRLPERRTTFRVDSYDYAKGDSVYTWRKIHGAGNAFITPNGTADADTATVIFDEVPGEYVFEVTMSDSRGLTEVSETVAVTINPQVGTLPANLPPTATPSSWIANRATGLPIILEGTDPEGGDLTYNIISDPTHGTLSGNPPSLIYLPTPDYLGADSFAFEVIDSEGETSSASVQITIEDSYGVGVAIYEPFDYAGDLNGQSGSSEVGLTGQWEVTREAPIENSSLSYGGVKTVGSHVMFTGGRAARDIDPSALSGNGLLDDGATLWCSFILERSENTGISKLGLALATNIFDGATKRRAIEKEGSLGGSGIGIYMDNERSGPSGHFVLLSRYGSGGDPRIEGQVHRNMIGPRKGIARLYILKLQWGETEEDFDVVEMYQPTQNLALPSEPVMSLSTHVNQGDFDTLTILRKTGDTLLDEIRFGPTYQSVIAGNVPMITDLTPPSAVAFLQGPSAASATSITMTANASADPSGGVEYYFTSVTGSGKDSGWQKSPSYTDTDLEPGTYGYTVKARDGSPAANETSPSAEGRATLSASTFIPDLAQVNRVDAESLLDYVGLRVGSVTYVRDPSLAAGTVMIQSPGMSPTPAVGTEVDLVIVTDNVTPLIRWSEEQGLHGLDARTTADPDGDRLINLVEFGLGLQPLANEMRAMDEHGSEHGLPSLASNHNGMEYYFIRRKDHSIPGSVAYTVQFSSDLVEFYDDFRTPTWVTNMADDDYELVKLSFPAMLPNGKPAQFARIQLTEIPPVD